MNFPCWSRSAAVMLLLACGAARGQGLLVVTGPERHVRLPRPIIIWPPWPIRTRSRSRRRSRRRPPTRSTQLEVDARLVDQVARVQVSQSFVNTGSRPLEVAFVFPLPYDGAIDRMTLLGRRQGVCRPS